MMFAGFLRREPVEMVRCETNDLEVPAQAEIVLEGYVNLNEMRTEGPVRRPYRLLLAGGGSIRSSTSPALRTAAIRSI